MYFVKTTGAMQVHSELPGDSYAIVLAVLGELEHRVGSEIVPVRSGMGLVQSPNQPVTVRTPGRFELIFLRRSRENVIQELGKMLVREISTNLIFSPCFNMLTFQAAASSLRWRKENRSTLICSLCVEHMPCGRPGFNVDPFTSLEDSIADAPMGTIGVAMQNQRWDIEFLKIFRRVGLRKSLMQSNAMLNPQSMPCSQNESRSPCETLAPGRFVP